MSGYPRQNNNNRYGNRRNIGLGGKAIYGRARPRKENYPPEVWERFQLAWNFNYRFFQTVICVITYNKKWCLESWKNKGFFS